MVAGQGLLWHQHLAAALLLLLLRLLQALLVRNVTTRKTCFDTSCGFIQCRSGRCM
jgi:hypothetical protein